LYLKWGESGFIKKGWSPWKKHHWKW